MSGCRRVFSSVTLLDPIGTLRVCNKHSLLWPLGTGTHPACASARATQLTARGASWTPLLVHVQVQQSREGARTASGTLPPGRCRLQWPQASLPLTPSPAQHDGHALLGSSPGAPSRKLGRLQTSPHFPAWGTALQHLAPSALHRYRFIYFIRFSNC